MTRGVARSLCDSWASCFINVFACYKKKNVNWPRLIWPTLYIKKTKKYGEKPFSIWRMEFLHPAMWHVALASWQWIHQVAVGLPCKVTHGSGWHVTEFAQTSAILECYFWFSLDFDHITAVDMSFCTSLRNFIQIWPSSAEKMTSCRFSRWRISAILDFRGRIMDSLKSLRTTSIGCQ